MLNSTVPALTMFIAAIVAAWLDTRLVRLTDWSKGRRIVTCSAPVPALILVATAAGIAWELFKPRTGVEMTDLAVAAILLVGGLFAVLTAIAGAVGAVMAERSRDA